MNHWLWWQSSAVHHSSATRRFQDGLFTQREQADARIFWVLIAQWAVVLVSSIAIAAQWKNVRVDALSSAVIWVGAFSIIPLAMILHSPGGWQSRWSMGLSQGIMSSILWAVSGGTPETHLHLFAWFVVLALYRDAVLLVATAAIAAVGHFMVWGNMSLPNLPDRETHLIWFTWLVGEAAFLGIFVLLDRQQLASEASREEALESLQDDFTGKIEGITHTLIEERDSLKTEVATLSQRRAVLESAQFDVSREINGLRRDVAAQATALLQLASRPADATLTREWRAQWQTLRRQAQHLMRLVDLPSLGVSQAESSHDSPNSKLTEADHDAAWNLPTVRRSLLLMRNPIQQAKAVAALESEGFKVDVVPNGPRTYYSVMLNDYSVIIVDIDLPGEEGFDTLEALRLLPEERIGQSKSLFAITAERTPDRILRCTELQVDGILDKPLNSETLQRLLGAGVRSFDKDSGVHANSHSYS